MLLINLGNSQVAIGLLSRGLVSIVSRFPTSQLTHTLPSIPQVSRCLISSVVPHRTAQLVGMVRQHYQVEPILLDRSVYHLLPIQLHNPDEVGTDLIANAVQAWYCHQQANVVIDFGTALSLTMTNDTGLLCGVAILPGLQTAMHALSTQTAQLPHVPLIMPKSVLGQDTPHAIQAGIVMGYKFLLHGLIQQARKELGPHLRVYATGGLAHILVDHLEGIDHFDPDFTLKGLAVIAQLL